MGKNSGRAGKKKDAVGPIRVTNVMVSVKSDSENGKSRMVMFSECGCGWKREAADPKSKNHKCDPQAKAAAKRALKEDKKKEQQKKSEIKKQEEPETSNKKGKKRY